jgi:hypothetical protein
MLGIVTDSVVREQKKSNKYKGGVKNLFTAVWTSINAFTQTAN